ncbi:hypothetical protein E4U53_007798, partial [Claviceps sorghi]
PKAVNYIEKLNGARCEGNWDAVPELVRKVRKHAPERTCLTLAAETECAISQVTAAGARPSAAQTAEDLDVSSRFPNLAAAIGQENHYHEDRYQARVCLGWLYWVVGEYSQALTALPSSLEAEGISPTSTETISEWTNLSVTPSLEGIWCGHGVRKQLRYWSELFLTEFCMLSSQAVENDELNLDDPESLAGFRAWARYWDIMGAPVTGGFGFKGSVPRRRIWAEYYETLSRILETDMLYIPGHVHSIPSDLPARAQLRMELKHCEAAYRALILNETTFPRADEDRLEVEDFVRRVMANWNILCGRGWREQDLGPGGRAAVSRTVLEALYSAATRTYHSTCILRSLFCVHLAVAEFDLAFRAFDSYLDIVKKGKAREEKTGHKEVSLDDQGTVLETMAQAIMALCRYGHQAAGEKARRLGAELEDWLSKLPQTKPAEKRTSLHSRDDSINGTRSLVSPQIIALAWQAIGLSHAHWSRITHEAGSRSEIQSKAIRCLRKSLAAEFGRSKDIRSYFSLALLLAERRELTAAIELVRSALLCNKGQEESYSLYHGPYWQERTLIPVWHLLALLLSARQDYTMAFRACEGALEQFKDASVLFGKAEGSFRSDHLKENAAATNGGAPGAPARGLVDDMDDSEKESILEVKMTQLALIELVEGPDVAVNASSELLSLYSRMFGALAAQSAASSSSIPLAVPKTAGTARSIRGTIFGHRADRLAPETRQAGTGVSVSVSVSVSTAAERSGPRSRSATTDSSLTAASIATASAAAPSIQVTEANANAPGRGHGRHGSSSQERRRNSLNKRSRSGSHQRPVTSAGPAFHQDTVTEEETFPTPATEADQLDFFKGLNKIAHARTPSGGRARPVSSLHSMVSATSKASDLTDFAIDMTHASPNVLPLVQCSKEKEKAKRLSLLIKIWLTIAGFYRRAGMLNDGRAAVLEAQKLLSGVEAESWGELSAGGETKDAGWAERRSVDDLWGDVWSELGLLGLAKGLPYSAKSDFETALTHSPDHPVAITELANILLDLYSEKLLPPPTVPALDSADNADGAGVTWPTEAVQEVFAETLPSAPLGLGGPGTKNGVSPRLLQKNEDDGHGHAAAPSTYDQLPAPYKATKLPLVDRLSARERAFTLLSGLTRLGTGWDNSDAWFALARAHEESGQAEKAKEVLWWCVELEEAKGVREWRSLSNGGYII